MSGLMLACLLVLANPPAVASLPPEVDDAQFAQELRERGLDDWLTQYEVDTPPADEAGRVLRERSQLLAEAADEKNADRRRERIARASEQLKSLIEKYPQDPRCLRWRFEYVRDLFERREPAVFDALLLYELPGDQAERARALAAQARRELTSLREGVAAAWGSLESLDEAALARLRTSGSVRQLEDIDNQSNMLSAWARLYGMLTEPDASRRQSDARQLLDDVLTAGWTELPAGHEARRCSALVLAAVSARAAARYDEADRYAREIIALQRSSPLPGGALRQASLIAVLEQVRILRDRGKVSEALTAARQAAAWIERTRAAEPSALIAAALLESSVLARQRSPATAPAAGVLLTPGGLQPLAALATRSVALRDDIYRALAGMPADPARLGDAFFLQLWAGSVIDDAQRADPARLARMHEQLTEVSRRLEQRIAAAGPSPASPDLPELLFLRGRAAVLLKDFAGAMGALTRLTEEWPQHERADAAAYAAVATARDWLAGVDADGPSRPRDAFIRAVRNWRSRSPEAPGVRQMQFFLAAELERNRQLSEAAREYAAVPVSDANHARAAVGQARCLRALVPAAASRPAGSAPSSPVPFLQEAMEAGQSGLSAALKAQPTEPCLVAEAAVGFARLANDPRAGRPADAAAALQQAWPALASCPAWHAPALRERLEAFRQLGRWSDLVEAFAEFVDRDGPNVDRSGRILLESIRQAVLRALEQGDDPGRRSAAAQGAQLAQMLLAAGGATAQAGPGESDVALELTRAWLLVHADRPDHALPVYERCRELLARRADAGLSVRCDLGRAECLLAEGRAATAAPLYTELLRRLPEHSDGWWEAYVGTLRCQEQLKADRAEIARSIQQQRRIAPALGGPRWRRAIENLEQALSSP